MARAVSADSPGGESAGEPLAPPIVHNVLRGAGRPLDAAVRADMEPRFGRDFGGVRIHDGPRAAASARAVEAEAYTVGHDIAFASGRYAPETAGGRALLAHELAHVVQQGGAAASDGLTVAPAATAEERAADDAADRVVRGETAGPLSAPGASAVRRLQRKEHGTYVSTLGEKAFLDAGAAFYKTWGHPNVKRVATMEEVVKDLDRASGTIDTFRIVTHANPAGLDIGLTPEVSPSFFGSTAAQFTEEKPFKERFTGRHLVNEAFAGRIYGKMIKDTAAKALLTKLGMGATLPDLNSAEGIVIRAAIETDFLARVPLKGGGAPDIKNRRVLDQYNRLRTTTYGKILQAKAPDKKGRKAIKKAISKLPGEVERVMVAAGLNYGEIEQSGADVLADPFTDTGGTRLNPEISRSIKEGATGKFLKKLRSVRGKIDATTHVEIRGCNAGDRPSLLDDIRGFFGAAGALPSISAPDLYQYFFRLSFRTFELRNPKDVTNMQTAFGDPDTGLAEGFEDKRRILGGELIRVVNDSKLTDLAKRYGLNAAKLEKLNPEIDPKRLVRGQDIWRVQRKTVKAGRYKTLKSLCQDYLGKSDEKTVKAVVAANPHIADPKALSKDDSIDVPAALLTAPLASAKPTAAELEAALNAGQAVTGLDANLGRPVVTTANKHRAKALGDWLAAQKFDPKGRTAAALTKLFKGKRFDKQTKKTYIAFLSHSYPNVEDPIFPQDPRHAGHIIKKP